MDIVVVGFGFMGMTHTLNILKNPNLRLKAIVDKNTENILSKLDEQVGNFATEKIDSEKLSGVNVYADLSECLEKEKPDACVIAVHTALHYELTRIALTAGAHVFLEKPFTLDVHQGEKLIDLAKSMNKILMVGHVLRFIPAYRMLEKWIKNAEYGELQFLSLTRLSGVPAWGEWKARQKDFGSSGGALFDLVIHDIDYAQHVCGIPDSIEAKIIPGRLSNHDYVSAWWHYNDSPVEVKIEGGNTFHTAFPFQASYAARFQNASVNFSTDRPDNIVVTTDDDTTLIPLEDANAGFANELNYFVDCIENGTQPFDCMPESALESIKLCYRHAEKY